MGRPARKSPLRCLLYLFWAALALTSAAAQQQVQLATGDEVATFTAPPEAANLLATSADAPLAAQTAANAIPVLTINQTVQSNVSQVEPRNKASRPPYACQMQSTFAKMCYGNLVSRQGFPASGRDTSFSRDMSHNLNL